MKPFILMRSGQDHFIHMGFSPTVGASSLPSASTSDLLSLRSCCMMSTGTNYLVMLIPAWTSIRGTLHEGLTFYRSQWLPTILRTSHHKANAVLCVLLHVIKCIDSSRNGSNGRDTEDEVRSSVGAVALAVTDDEELPQPIPRGKGDRQPKPPTS